MTQLALVPDYRSMQACLRALFSNDETPSLEEYSIPSKFMEMIQDLHDVHVNEGKKGVRVRYVQMTKDEKWRELCQETTRIVSGSTPDDLPVSDSPKERTYQLRPLSYFKNMPPREWGVHGIIRVRGTSVFFGNSGSGKSATVLDMMLCRACNVPFIGRKVIPTFLIWVGAESIDEFYPRVIAWLGCHGLSEDDPINMLILDRAVPFNNVAEIETFIQEVKEQLAEANVPDTLPLSFVFDTYARCTPGADENSTQETKVITETIDHVSKAFDAHIAIIHHTNAQDKMRGNTAFRAVIDTAWKISKEGNAITMYGDKMRGAPDGETIYAEMRSIVYDARNPQETAPVVFAPEGIGPETGKDQPSLSKPQKQMLEMLYLHGVMISTDWQKQCADAYGIAKSSFYNYLPALTEGTYVNKPEEAIKGKRVEYQLLEKGLQLFK